MAEKKSGGGTTRYRKIAESGFSDRLFSWKKVQSEVDSAEREYIKIAKSLSAANRNIEALEANVSELNKEIQTEKKKSAELSKKLEEELTAHELLKANYEADTKNWSSEVTTIEDEVTFTQSECNALKFSLEEKEKEVVSLQMQISILKGEIEKTLAEKGDELSNKSASYNNLSTEYTGLVREKNETVEKLYEEMEALKIAHQREIEQLKAEHAEKSKSYIPTIHELTRDVDSWKYQRECDLTELHRLKTALDSREKELAQIKEELGKQNEIKQEMLTKINHTAYIMSKNESENYAKEERMKAEYAQLQKEFDALKSTNSSLKDDLSQERNVLSTYTNIIDEISAEWENHPEVTKARLIEATGSAPVPANNGFVAKINGNQVFFGVFTPKSYDELRKADALVRETAKIIAKTHHESCRNEAFIVVPEECLMYLKKTWYASPKVSVEVITPVQIQSAAANISRFVIYDKSLSR